VTSRFYDLGNQQGGTHKAERQPRIDDVTGRRYFAAASTTCFDVANAYQGELAWAREQLFSAQKKH
jgi:hypothetical protein